MTHEKRKSIFFQQYVRKTATAKQLIHIVNKSSCTFCPSKSLSLWRILILLTALTHSLHLVFCYSKNPSFEPKYNTLCKCFIPHIVFWRCSIMFWQKSNLFQWKIYRDTRKSTRSDFIHFICFHNFFIFFWKLSCCSCIGFSYYSI